MKRANINSIIMIKSAQELVISFEPASGASVFRHMSDHRVVELSREGGQVAARVPSGSVSSDARPRRKE